jgi:signal transduction histidine kinase
MRVSNWLQCFQATALFLFCCIASFGQNPYALNDTSVVHRLDGHVYVFIDSSDHLSVDEVSSPDFQNRFFRKGDLTFGYLKSTIWLKVNTQARSFHTQWYLEIPAPFLEYVDFYQKGLQGEWLHSMAGYYRKQSDRAVSHTAHVLPLIFNAEGKSCVYIRIGGLSPKTFPLLIIEKEKFYQKTRFEDIGYGIFFGILFVMFFYNLFIYVSLKHINYLLYICTIMCTFMIFAAASGYGGKFLWPENPEMNFYGGRMSLGITAIVLSIFTIRFMEVKRYSVVMYYILLALIPLGIIANILVITKTMSSAGNNLISLSTIIYLTTGIVCRIKGNKTANFFIAAWAFYLVGGLLLTLRNSGVFDFNFWTTHFVEVGAALETIIIAFALGERYRRYKKEKEDAQLQALKLQQEANEKLEQKVAERTEQLSKAFEELTQTLDTNTRQTRIIEDKNAELDAFFYRISHDLRGPIRSLLALSDLAKKDNVDNNAIVYMERQHQQVERLNTIINGLINLTKLNDVNLKREKIDVDKMVSGCIASFTSEGNFSRLSFIKEIDAGLEFYSEWTLLNAIVQNLIENAIKYAGDQSPFVKIKVEGRDENIVIEVSDNGDGISPEHQAHIFEMFYRATESGKGTGLGLYILKRSVERLKGTVEIKSEVGQGSVFTVMLPRYPN